MFYDSSFQILHYLFLFLSLNSSSFFLRLFFFVANVSHAMKIEQLGLPLLANQVLLVYVKKKNIFKVMTMQRYVICAHLVPSAPLTVLTSCIFMPSLVIGCQVI